MTDLFKFHFLAAAVAMRLCAANETVSTLDLTESLVGGMAVTHAGTMMVPAWDNYTITTEKGDT
jgi:hypothetical protein